MPENEKPKPADEAAAADRSAKDAKKPASKKKTRDVAILRVTGPARGRRRCGHAFGADPVDLRVEDLTPDDVAAIQSDPELISSFGTRAEEIGGDDA